MNNNRYMLMTAKYRYSTPPPHRAVLNQIKDGAVTMLTDNLKKLFNSCDDLFFDLSSRAASNNEQNLYFESMRELRLKKRGTIRTFRKTIEDHFASLVTTSTATAQQLPYTRLPDSLSLVQENEVEKNVAISSMISKNRNSHHEALAHLTKRLDHVINHNNITQSNNPLDPQQLCHNFAAACETLNVHIKAQIIIYKQFDRLVISQLGKVYSVANEQLINAGIMPDIHPQSITTSTLHTNNTRKSHNSTRQETPKPALDTLKQLLTGQYFTHTEQAGISNTYSHNPGALMTANELIQAVQVFAKMDKCTTDNKLRMLVHKALSISSSEKPRAITPIVENTINLIALFFDFVLKDHNLPATFQLLICRLQIPILRVALKDPSFFDNDSNPARQILNTLAASGLGWDSDSPEKDKLYQMLSQAVNDIVAQHAENGAIFEIKHAEIEQFIQQNEHRSELIEARTNQAARGKAITTHAKMETQKALFTALKKPALPKQISHFLIEQWQPYMLISYIKYGKDSPEWLEARQLIQDLIWACQQHSDERSVQRLKRISPNLLSQIRHGLSQTILTPGQEPQTQINQIAQILTLRQSNNTSIKTQLLEREQAQALGHTVSGDGKSWQEIATIENQPPQDATLTYEHIKKAESISINTWIDYELPTQGKHIRCKLASKVDISDQYIFVNRFGFKVIERKRKHFAYDLQRELAKPLASSPLFDRAFGNICSGLQHQGKT